MGIATKGHKRAQEFKPRIIRITRVGIEQKQTKVTRSRSETTKNTNHTNRTKLEFPGQPSRAWQDLPPPSRGYRTPTVELPAKGKIAIGGTQGDYSRQPTGQPTVKWSCSKAPTSCGVRLTARKLGNHYCTTFCTFLGAAPCKSTTYTQNCTMEIWSVDQGESIATTPTSHRLFSAGQQSLAAPQRELERQK